MNEREEVVLDNGIVRAVFDLTTVGVSETYSVLGDGGATVVATSAPGASFSACTLACEDAGQHPANAGPVSSAGFTVARLNPDHRTREPLLSVAEAAPVRRFEYEEHELLTGPDHQKVRLRARSTAGDVLTRVVALHAGEPYFRVHNELELAGPVSLEFFWDRYAFAPGPDVDFTWLPLLKMDPSCVAADWSFKSPAAIIQKGGAALALVPDLSTFGNGDALRRCSHALDLDITERPHPIAAYGCVPSQPRYHSFFVHPEGLRQRIPDTVLSYTYYLIPFTDAPERQVYRDVVAFLWDRFGHRNLLEGHAAQQKSFQLWEKEAWYGYGNLLWYDAELNGQACGAYEASVFKFDQLAWFSPWFNNLFAALGQKAFSARTGDHVAAERAERTVRLALQAPRNGGAFAVGFYRDSDGYHWTPGSPSNFGYFRDAYHAFSMSWTGYLLLKWLGQYAPDDKEILDRCLGLGDFLVANQLESGFIPSFFNRDLSVRSNGQVTERAGLEDEVAESFIGQGYRITGDDVGLNRISAEPAACAVFLCELFKVSGKEQYLRAAIDAMDYIEGHILPENKWFDYETFYSCSRKPFGFYDQITGQHPQNNMATIQAAMAYLALHRATEQSKYLELGIRVLDYLSLTQQVWSHPLLEPNLIGGFTTQNTDAEWNDARQAYCALVYLDYFEVTDKLEYLERGIAALRASLAVAPYENWSHMGYGNEPGTFSSFHWGLGSGVAAIDMVYGSYGDVLVSVDGGWAYGVNGCTVTDVTTGQDRVDLVVISGIKWVTPLRLVFRDVPSGNYVVTINGRRVGEFPADELAAGIEWHFHRE